MVLVLPFVTCLPMTETSKICPRGMVFNLRAPYSGVLNETIVCDSLALLPDALAELATAWSQVGEPRNSGVCFSTRGQPLDDAIREEKWEPNLQQHMPVAGGIAGSRGRPQQWQYLEPERMDQAISKNE